MIRDTVRTSRSLHALLIAFTTGAGLACFSADHGFGADSGTMDGDAGSEDDMGDGPASESCGDGIVDPGEECDEGEANADTQACKSDCTAQVCGDGHVHLGVEQCDDGNDLDNDGCRSDCTTAECGDGVVWEGVEECDDGNLDGSDLCTSVCTVAECGDGYVWAGVETCDDGNLDSSDACTQDCQLAECGDGFVHEGVEECDDGNAIDTDACLSSCALAKCGDGFIEEGVEACDGNDVSPNECGGDCDYAFRLVFVTSSTHTGNLGGLEGADAICEARADEAGLPGTYLAWLSSDEGDPAGRFTHSDKPYVLVNGEQIADDWDDLTDGTLDSAIAVTESGGEMPVSGCEGWYTYNAWTGTDKFGSKYFSSRCSDWTTGYSGKSGYVGNPEATNSEWTLVVAVDCDCKNPIYCFQQ